MARKWVPIADNTIGGQGIGGIPDDPQAWSDVNEMWPVQGGGYSVCDQYSAAATRTATGETVGDTRLAFAAGTPTGTVSYVVSGTKIWQVDSGGAAVTDRTGGVSFGLGPRMAQYGNVTVCCMSTSAAVVTATPGNNFAALSGAPNAVIPVVQSNVLLLFNTSTDKDGWAASDVGDYTNWSTNEAASGRLLQTPGPILGAVAFRDSVYAFKRGSIYRGDYVGGVVKWSWQLVSRRHGLGNAGVPYSLVVADKGMYFVPNIATGQQVARQLFFFDGINEPYPLNTGAELSAESGAVYLTYEPATNRLCLTGSNQYFYEIDGGRWGKAGAPLGQVIEGDQTDVQAHYGAIPTRPLTWLASTNALTLYTTNIPEITSSYPFTAYVETARVGIGDPDKLSTTIRVIPLLRRRLSNEHTTGSASLSYTTYTERHGGTAAGPTSVTESSQKHRFDMTVAAPYSKFKITFTSLVVEIDDVLIKSKPSGEA